MFYNIISSPLLLIPSKFFMVINLWSDCPKVHPAFKRRLHRPCPFSPREIEFVFSRYASREAVSMSNQVVSCGLKGFHGIKQRYCFKTNSGPGGSGVDGSFSLVSWRQGEDEGKLLVRAWCRKAGSLMVSFRSQQPEMSSLQLMLGLMSRVRP